MKHVLILEDDLEFANTLAERLQAEGHNCLVISKTQDLLPALKKHEVKLILSDIMLDKATSLSILKLLDYKKISTPIVFMTGFDDIPGLSTAMGDKVVIDVLIKPFKVENLLTILSKLPK